MSQHRMRRCVMCRQSDLKDGLLRFVLKDEQVVWDREMKMEGRGAYLHPRSECWMKFCEKDRWKHAFRRSFSGDGLLELQRQIEREVF